MQVSGLQKLYVNPSTGQKLCIGKSGQFYAYSNGKWECQLTESARLLTDVVAENGSYYVVGSQGYFKTGTLVNNTFVSTELLLNTGNLVSSQVTDQLNSICSNQGKMYVVGQNGRILYSPSVQTAAFSAVQIGTSNLNDVSVFSASNSTKFTCVGDQSTVLNLVGTSAIYRKDLFTANLIDIHFVNANTGTLLAANNCVRQLSASTNWKCIVPSSTSGSLLTTPLQKVWTLNNGFAYLFGQGSSAIIQSSQAQLSTNLPIDIRDLAQLNDKLYIAKTTLYCAHKLQAMQRSLP